MMVSAINTYHESQTGLENKPRWDKCRAQLHEEERKTRQDRPYTHDEIRDMLTRVGSNFYALILFLSCTAVRKQVIYEKGDKPYFLAVGDLEPIEHEKYGKMYKVTAYRGTKHQYIVFCTPECRKAIDSYLDERRRAGEIITPKSPLFRTKYNTRPAPRGTWKTRYKSGRRDFTDPDKRKITKEEAEAERIHHIEVPEPLKADSVSTVIRKTRIACGIVEATSNPLGKWVNDVPVLNGFRRFAISQMAEAGVDLEARKQMTDHTIGVEKHYVYGKLLDEYVKAIPKLTIHPREILEAENAQLKGEQAEEIKGVKSEIKEVRWTMGKMFDFMDRQERRLQGTDKRIIVEQDKPQLEYKDLSKEDKKRMLKAALEELDKEQ